MLEIDTKENCDNMALSGQLNTGEQNLGPIHGKEDSDQFFLPNIDLICEKEHTPDIEKEVGDMSFNDDGEYRSIKKNRHVLVEVSDIDKSAVPVYSGMIDAETASEVEGRFKEKEDLNNTCAEKSPETEVELKESEETDNDKKHEEESTDSIFEDAPRPDSLIAAPSGNKSGNIRTTRIDSETKFESDFQNYSDNMDNDDHFKATVYDKVKSCIVSKPNIKLDKLGENEKIPDDRNDLENKQSFHHSVHESSLQEKTFEHSKDKSSLVNGSDGRNWPFIGGNFVTDTYCISSEKSFSTKNEKDQFNYQTKGSYNSSKKSIEESRSSCKSCIAECSYFQLAFEEILNQHMVKMRDCLRGDLDQRARELQHSMESLRKSTLAVGLDKASSAARNSNQSNTNYDDGNNVNKTSHVRMDCNTMLDQTLHIDFEDTDSYSETRVKYSNSNAQIHSMHPLKFQNISEDHSLGVEHYSSSGTRESRSEADDMPSSYPETLSSFQGRSSVTCDEVFIDSCNTTSNINSDRMKDEVLSDKSLNDFSDRDEVQSSFQDDEENWSENVVVIDNMAKEDYDMKLSSRDDDKKMDKNTAKTCLMTDQTSEQINTRVSDSTSMYSSGESFETFSVYHDLVEDQKFETKLRDDHEEESEKKFIDNDVNGPNIEDIENIAESFSQEVMKEFEKSMEKHSISQMCNNSSFAEDENRIEDSRMDATSDEAENEILKHEKYYEKDEDTELTAAFVDFGEKTFERFHTSEADKVPDDLLNSEAVHNDKMHFDMIPDDKISEEDPSVASLSLSTCCTPLGDYEGSDCAYESLGSDCADESFNVVVMTRRLPRRRIGETRRISRQRTVKQSEIKDRETYIGSGWRKCNIKIKQNQYQRKMPSKLKTSFSINDIVNKPKPRQNKKMDRTCRNFMGMNKSVNLETLNQSSYCRDKRSVLFRSTQKKQNFIEVDEKVRQEFGDDQNGHRNYDKIQYQVVEDVDSGIFSSLMSVRSSILKEHNTYMRSLPSKGKERKTKFRKSHRELHRLDSELNSFLRSLERTVARHVTNEGVVFGLERYFESLNNGQTPSLQQQMTYEWLRLMSFSNYTGEGSPVHLARNGFYHSLNNETRCFCCNTSYSTWTYSDNVQEVHRRISPNCPFVHGGIESNENISIESGTRDNRPHQALSNLGGASGTGIAPAASQSRYSAERPAAPTYHGGFAGTAAQSPCSGCQPSVSTAAPAPTFSFHQPEPRPDPSGFRFPQTSNQYPSGVPSQVGQSAATVTTTAATGFSFGSVVNTPAPAGFTFGQSTSQQGGGSDIASQLRALTLQQSIGPQQPSDEPISGNPVIAPTQPLQVARQTGEDQLSISAQQPPETSDLPQNAARNQRNLEPSGSAPPAQRNENADTIEIAQLKHPRYRTMDVRMSSFRSWPNYLNQTPRQMAYAGFFHPGVADFARCFCCGGGLRNWEADDDPMVEHARWYPRCEYINKLKGTHFVQAVLRRHREHMAERQREHEVPQNTFLTPDPMTTSVAANLLEMGFTQERAREAILAVRRLRGRSEVSIEEVTSWMLDDGNTQHQEPADRGTTVNPRDTVATAPPQPPRPHTPASSGSGSFESAVTSRRDSDGHSSVEDRGRGSTEEPQGATGGAKKEDKPPKAKSSKEDSSSDEKNKSGKEDYSDDEKTKKDKDKSSKEDYSSDDKSKKDKDPDKKKPKSKKDKKTKSRKGQSPASGEGASADVDTKSLKEENKQLKQMQVCKICMDKYVSITFLPCGHLVCCEDCAKNMRKCPICRKRIKGQVRTFMS